ncbi:MAG: hypothetical protein V1850_06340 [Candidatus Bathyarchaeota archaeon]
MERKLGKAKEIKVEGFSADAWVEKVTGGYNIVIQIPFCSAAGAQLALQQIIGYLKVDR